WYAVPAPTGIIWDQYWSTGVDHPSGLAWPRIVGKRNGVDYRYTCATPALVKDAVSLNPASFYRLPWHGGMAYQVTQGNNTSFTHSGKQKYASDFGMPAGTTIRAARGGRVTFVDESNTKNCYPVVDPSCTPNNMRIQHQDGTYSWYVHM